MDRVFEKVWFLPPYLVARKTAFIDKHAYTLGTQVSDTEEEKYQLKRDVSTITW